MKATTRVTVDLTRPAVAVVVYAKQWDKLSRYIEIAMFNGGASFSPPTGSTYEVRGIKPDGTVLKYSVDEAGDPAVTVSGHIATLTLAQQALACPGDVRLELAIKNGSEILTCFSFILRVEVSAIANVTSSNYVSPALTTFIPSVSAAGVISWTNDGGLPNPTPRNIKGSPGAKGEQGEPGHSPYIGDNGNWYAWDEETEEYADTGVDASGYEMTQEDADARYLKLTGGTMAGTLMMSNHKISQVAAPDSGGDAANKTYVDNAIEDIETELTPISVHIANVGIHVTGWDKIKTNTSLRSYPVDFSTVAELTAAANGFYYQKTSRRFNIGGETLTLEGTFGKVYCASGSVQLEIPADCTAYVKIQADGVRGVIVGDNYTESFADDSASTQNKAIADYVLTSAELLAMSDKKGITEYVDEQGEKYLPLAGGMMSGDIELNGNKLKFGQSGVYLTDVQSNALMFRGEDNEKVSVDGIATPVTDYHAANKKYVDDHIPTVNNATLTIKQGGVTKGTFSANASANVEINLDAGGSADNTFVVNGTYDGVYVDDMSKTFAEILAAHTAGKIVELHLKSDEDGTEWVLPMTGIAEGEEIAFSGPETSGYAPGHNGNVVVKVTNEDVCSLEYVDFATETYVDSAIAAAIGDAIGGAY